MRLIFLTNFYPPYGQGGYEQWCQEVAEGLQARGHTLLVLTSRHGCERAKTQEPSWIQRVLHLEMELKSLRNGVKFFTQRHAREQKNLFYLQQSVDTFQPDAVLVWGMWNLTHALPVLAEQLLPGRVVYYIGDYWPTLPSQHEYYWQTPPRNWKTRLPKHLLKFFATRMLAQEQRPTPAFAHVIFPTVFMRNELKRMGMCAQRTQIIYAAADTSLYLHDKPTALPQPDHKLALLYAGRITADKGVHVAVEAVALLVHQYRLHDITLRIVGGGDPAYLAQLRHLVEQKAISEYVCFSGAQPKQNMPQIYQQADIFLFTSIWQEPFGRVLIEAMAAGAVVVGSPTGGAAEILIHGENALTFPPGDAAALAAQVARLVQTPQLRQQLVAAGKKIAQEKFDITRMTSEIEEYLQVIATNTHQNPV